MGTLELMCETGAVCRLKYSVVANMAVVPRVCPPVRPRTVRRHREGTDRGVRAAVASDWPPRPMRRSCKRLESRGHQRSHCVAGSTAARLGRNAFRAHSAQVTGSPESSPCKTSMSTLAVGHSTDGNVGLAGVPVPPRGRRCNQGQGAQLSPQADAKYAPPGPGFALLSCAAWQMATPATRAARACQRVCTYGASGEPRRAMTAGGRRLPGRCYRGLCNGPRR